MHLVGFTIEIYYDARSYKRPIFLYTYDLFHYAVSISEYTSANCRVINERESGKKFRGSLSDLSEVIFHNLTVRTETNHETFSWPPKHLPECTSDELPPELIYSAKDAKKRRKQKTFNPLNPELNPICYLLALLGAPHFLHVSRIRVKLLTFRLLMSYIYIYIYIWSTHS